MILIYLLTISMKFQIDISVVDINDNKPYFIYTPNPAYSQYLSIVSVDPEGYESLPQTCLTQLKAMDDDSGVNGEVSTFAMHDYIVIFYLIYLYWKHTYNIICYNVY